MTLLSRVSALAFGLLAANLDAAERRANADVDTGTFTQELQRVNNDHGVVVAWWIPAEYWEVALGREKSMSAVQLEDVMKTLRQYSFISVVDGKVVGADIEFQGREVVAKSLVVEIVDAAGKTTRVAPLDPVPEDVQPLLAVLAPAMAAAMGNLGQNLHFFVFRDQVEGRRLFSPLDTGAVVVRMVGRGGRPDVNVNIDRPIDSLYVPRRCANGKPAHVSWNFCPWDGKKLPQ